MVIKRIGFLSALVAFFMGLGIALGFGAGSGFHTDGFAAPRYGQPFAATAPAVAGGAAAAQLSASAVAAAPAVVNAPAVGTSLTAEQIVDRVGPAVVTVINKQRYSGANRRVMPNIPGAPTAAAGAGSPVDAGLGSGVIYDMQGYILTNNHVVEMATAIDVVLADGTRVDATLVGRDPSIDVAVLKIDPAKVPAAAVLGNSDALKPGMRVVAIGSPEALENSVTEGIVSGLNRRIDTYIGLIQTDAAINHGNSGGPLLNAQGEVVGLNTLGIRDENAEGLNFAIPINRAKSVAQQLVQKGGGSVVVTRAYLGVTTDQLNTSKAAQYGVKLTSGEYVTGVNANAPAAKAGLKQGDVITAVNGTALNARTGLGDVLSNVAPGTTITLTIDRGGTAQTLMATVVERPADNR